MMVRLFFYILVLVATVHEAFAFSNPDTPVLHKLPSFINSPYTDEIAPILTWDDNTLYFTRIKDPNFNKTIIFDSEDLYKKFTYSEYTKFISGVFELLGDERREEDIYLSPFNQDIYIVEKNGDQINELVHPDHPLNNALPNSALAIMPDQTTLVLMNQFYLNGSMYKGFSKSKKISKNKFSFPEPVFIYDFKEMAGNQANLALSRNGEVMILAFAEEQGEDTDLFVSLRVNTDTYSEPIRLPDNLNTEFREFSPALSEDGKYLFFSSNKGSFPNHSNIYISQRLSDDYTKWSDPMKLKAPVNTFHNEGHPFVVGKKLYFCSDRDGSWDIFYLDFDGNKDLGDLPDEEYIVVEEESPPRNVRGEVEESQNSDIQVPVEPKIESVLVKVVDSKTGDALSAKLIKSEVGKSENKVLNVGEKGLLLEMKDPVETIFQPLKDGYISKTRRYDLKAMMENAKSVPELHIPVDPIAVDAKISMDPIFFKRGSDRILNVSYPEIERLAGILKSHPEVHIKVEGHTDNFGDAKALIALSDKRAFAVKRFLTSRGISPMRIDTKGYGASQPITDNSTEALKAKNRRVEIVITQVQ
ncbi:OmpA family protein [Membranihabitans maritimus]|uniref:OmpA family protein n=1 Tax=Membranihabitans maritimus TaxID=2904244 RepID=UPI001F2E3C59|nr:OmpA family protein [Membranihabitans maritimus]